MPPVARCPGPKQRLPCLGKTALGTCGDTGRRCVSQYLVRDPCLRGRNDQASAAPDGPFAEDILPREPFPLLPRPTRPANGSARSSPPPPQAPRAALPRVANGQADQPLSSMAIAPRAGSKPLLLVAGAVGSSGLELYARVQERVHEPLIKAEYCEHLQVRTRRFGAAGDARPRPFLLEEARRPARGGACFLRKY